MAKRLAALVFVLAAGCAPKVAAPPELPSKPLHPEFVFPAVPTGTPQAEASLIEFGWRYLQVDNLPTAERTFQEVLKRVPGFHPAEAGLGYVELADRDAKNAVSHFDRALDKAANYAPALVGRGQALLELNRDADALVSFEAALKADPSLVDLQGRIDVLRFRALQDSLARAKAATEASRWDEARAAYQQAIAASPESAFLYRELALVDRKSGDSDIALQHFQKAVALDPNDARAHAQIAAILEERHDPTAALAEYEKARALDAAEVPDAVLTRAREAAALTSLPPEYRALPSATEATRADIAALIGVRLASVVTQAQQRQIVITDVRNSWAQQWIVPVVRAGIMDTQPNYTFQPGARVRRGDLAQTVSRVLGLIETRNPSRAKAWQTAAPKIADVTPSHLNYGAVSQAVTSGVMPLENGAFQLLKPVSGAEAVAVIGRLEALAKP